METANIGVQFFSPPIVRHALLLHNRIEDLLGNHGQSWGDDGVVGQKIVPNLLHIVYSLAETTNQKNAGQLRKVSRIRFVLYSD